MTLSSLPRARVVVRYVLHVFCARWGNFCSMPGLVRVFPQQCGGTRAPVPPCRDVLSPTRYCRTRESSSSVSFNPFSVVIVFIIVIVIVVVMIAFIVIVVVTTTRFPFFFPRFPRFVVSHRACKASVAPTTRHSLRRCARATRRTPMCCTLWTRDRSRCDRTTDTDDDDDDDPTYHPCG